MKKNFFKHTLAAITAAAVLITGSAPVSAATIKATETTRQNQLRVQITSEDDEYMVRFRSTNLKTGNTQTVGSRYTITSLNLNSNVWYKTSLRSYDYYGTLLRQKTYYLAKSPMLNAIKLYGSNRMKISWPRTSGASGYIVYMRTGASGSFKRVKTTTSTSYITGALQKYKNYYFYVRSYKKAGSKTYYSAKPTYYRYGYIYTKYYY